MVAAIEEVVMVGAEVVTTKTIMRRHRINLLQVLIFSLVMGPFAHAAGGFEVFGKGAISRNHISKTNYTTALSITGGVALKIFSRVRVELRYRNRTSIQKSVDIIVNSTEVTLSDFKSESNSYTVGLDIDLLGKKSNFQPFIFLGGGYIISDRSYWVTQEGQIPEFFQEKKKYAISANVGVGFRLYIVNAIAFEVEAFGSAFDIDQPELIVDWYGTVGLRFFF